MTRLFAAGMALLFAFSMLPTIRAQSLSKIQLREVDRLALNLLEYSEELHDEYHQHLEGIRYAEVLDEDVTALERIAHQIHDLAHDAPAYDPMATRQLQKFTDRFIQLSFRIDRTIDLTEPWLRTAGARQGIHHMRGAARQIKNIVFQMDRFLPTDETVMDDQAKLLEDAVKELHDEFHEHLEGYEHSRHIDEDLEALERLVEHMHELAHGRHLSMINLPHLRQDIAEVRESVGHIDALLIRQSRVGVRTIDWIGIQHSRDAISDVLASATLLDHMIQKVGGMQHRDDGHDHRDYDRRRPRRDRHGHGIGVFDL